ncbi:hypothetical protein PUR28_01260, partial [Streptomyces sp. BE308]|uniref:hypothetical protein n=1 Tax=Streptomyces sp. BE308 TaxID=3002529 RepID=UPI002E792C3B
GGWVVVFFVFFVVCLFGLWFWVLLFLFLVVLVLLRVRFFNDDSLLLTAPLKVYRLGVARAPPHPLLIGDVGVKNKNNGTQKHQTQTHKQQK